MADFTPEKCKQIALARLDIVHKWLDKNQKTPPPEIYSLINILKEIPLVKQYTDSLQSEQTKKKEQKCLTPEFIRQIEKEILGINYE